MLIVGRAWPSSESEEGERYRLQGETMVPQTALIPLGTGRDSSGRINFAAHPPGWRRQKMLFCAPRTDRTEEAVPVQNGGSVSVLPSLTSHSV
jgi:hypothetical protein